MTLKPFEEQPNQTLAKALLILDAFSNEKKEWGIRDLGRKVGINPATVYRLVSTLHNAGYLEKNPATQTYSLGPSIMKLASLYSNQNPLPIIARKVFEKYADSFDHNFYLAQLHNFEVIYLAVLDGRGPIKIVTNPGGITNLHSTALGKVLLAYQSTEFINQYFNSKVLNPLTNHTIASRELLNKQLELVRQRGYAINEGEQYQDVGATSVPIIWPQKKVTLAVSVAYPAHLVKEEKLKYPELISLLNEMAQEIAERYNPVI